MGCVPPPNGINLCIEGARCSSEVPATASLLASPASRSYEHQQGRKLLSDMEYVVDFVNMQRFHDPLLVHILEAMRTPGG